MSKVTNVTYENNTKIQLYFEKVYFVVLHIKKEKYMIKENKISKIDKMNFSPSNLKYELQDFHNFFELTNFKEPIDVPRIIYESIDNEDKYLCYMIFHSSFIIEDIFKNIEINKISKDLEKYLLFYESIRYNLSYDDEKLVSSIINSNHKKYIIIY